MYNSTFNKRILYLCLALSVGLVGCDQVSSFKDYFKSNDKAAPAPAPVQRQAAAPAQTQVTKVPSWGPNTLAMVGGWSITIEEFNERLKNLKEVIPEYDINDLESKKLILEELVRQQLLVVDAEQTGLSKRPDIVEAVDEFRKTLLVREVATKITETTGEATNLEAQEYYNQNKEFLVEPAEFHVKEIVTNTQVGAKEILIELLQGGDFDKIARERSVAKSGLKGGDLGFISEPPFPQMGTALLGMNEGDVSNVFKGPDGFYVVRLEEKRGGEEKKFSEVKDEIIAGLTIIKQQQALLNYIDSLKEKVAVKTNEELLKTPVEGSDPQAKTESMTNGS